MQVVLGVLFLVAIVIAALLLTLGAIALIRRDRDQIHGAGNLGAAMQELESLFVESKKHIIEAERADEEDAETSGDPPLK